jgi:hypothetical protein
MPCRRASLFIGALLANLGGVRSPGLLRDKKSICGFFLDPEAIKILSLGAIWKFGKGTRLT